MNSVKKYVTLLLMTILTVTLAAGNVKSINESEFASEIASGYSLVDFWAPWCGPCNRLGPVLEKLSGDYPNIKFLKVNVDENRKLSGQFGVRSIPYVVLFKDGQQVDSFKGAIPEPAIQKFLTSNVKTTVSAEMNFKTAYDFTLTDLDGNKIKLSDVKGVIVLDFWATWCPPCKEEIPFLVKLRKKYPDLKIIGISNEKKEKLLEFKDSMKMKGVEIDYPILMDSDSSVSSMYRIKSIPATYIIGKDGNLIKKEVGFSKEMENDFEKVISEALK